MAVQLRYQSLKQRTPSAINEYAYYVPEGNVIETLAEDIRLLLAIFSLKNATSRLYLLTFAPNKIYSLLTQLLRDRCNYLANK